jgi:hypothetical protein
MERIEKIVSFFEENGKFDNMIMAFANKYL